MGDSQHHLLLRSAHNAAKAGRWRLIAMAALLAAGVKSKIPFIGMAATEPHGARWISLFLRVITHAAVRCIAGAEPTTSIPRRVV
ncbi:MAG: hypothetical protein JXO72_08430 [Vicinamibacteria bacterium]|nr:hypothetical protein [Vicinamibacteria bacterium]